jgi:ABC-type transport system involved in Fe-S cluster assembly fused permease/ATPase subunit
LIRLAREHDSNYLNSMRHFSAPDDDHIETASGGMWSAIKRVVGVLSEKELSKWRFRMALALVLTVLAKLLSVSAPLYLGEAITLASKQQTGSILIPLLTAISIFAGARFLSSAIPQFRDLFFVAVSQDAQRHLAVKTFAKAQSLSLGFHQTRRSGALNRVIERGAGAVDTVLRFLVFNISPTLIELALAAGVMAVAYTPVLSLIAVVTIAVYIVFTLIVTEWRAKQRRVLNRTDTELRAKIIDSLSNFETVKAFAAEERETGRFDHSFRKYNHRYVETMRSLNFLNVGQEFIMNAGMAAMLIYTGLKVSAGELDVGALAAVFAMLLNIYRPLNILGWGWREIRQSVIDLEKLFGLLGMTPEVDDAPDAVVLQKAMGGVRFEHVGFSHDGRYTGLHDISFDLKPGRHLAIVGPSGAGKSTLLKLLFRFFDVEEGSVQLDGRDVRELTQKSLRENLGLVPQDVVLFNDTIRQNILYGCPDATEEDLRRAAASAQLLDFIEGLPEGWDTRVGERGLKLSGGEKQRVGLARVVLKDPKILVLDEATSALDSQTESLVQQAISRASQGRTTLTVAHRLSTIMSADMILVLNDGRVAERGTHGELIALNGLYADMWKKQSNHVKEEARIAVSGEE